MRKNAILMVVMVACAMTLVGPIQAQTEAEIGIKGGLGFANLTGDVTGTTAMLSFGGGALFRISPSPQFSIQPEALVVLKGAKSKDPDGEKMNLTYFEVPALLLYRPMIEGTVRPAFFAGPAIGVLLSAKIGNDDIKNQMNTTDFGLVFGAGVDFESGARGKISLDGRYTMGISNIAKDSGNDSVKNGVFFVSVSYIFPLGQ